MVPHSRGRQPRRHETADRSRQGASDQGKPDPRRDAREVENQYEARARAEIAKNNTDRDPRHAHVAALSGALSIVTVPDDKALAAYTETVYETCPYSDKLLTDAPNRTRTAIPTKVGDPSPIKHVLYIIKENRTYDQVFGDMARGNGDPSLVMFGAR